VKNARFQKIEHVKLQYFADVLNLFDGNKAKTARELGISCRTARNYVNRCRELGIHALSARDNSIKGDRIDSEKTSDEYDLKIFPTNEYRLKYRDDMLNRDFLHN